jgi:hypothetical protein
VEIGADRLDAEDEDEEIKGIQRPAGERGEEGVPLRAAELGEVIEQSHRTSF